MRGLMMVVLALALAACGGGGNGENEANDAPQESAPKPVCAASRCI